MSLDPSYKNFGWCMFVDGIVVDSGVLETKPDGNEGFFNDHMRRVIYLASGFLTLLRQYSPDFVISEMPLTGLQGRKAAFGLGVATALVVAMCHGYGIPLVPMHPDDGKLSLLGVRKIKKKESKKEHKKKMVAAARKKWPEIKWPLAKNGKDEKTTIHEHVADAAGAFLAYQQKKEKGEL